MRSELMKIRRLDIGDFGIYSNQTMDQLNSNMVVVGGLNRAGKSSLLEILRYLGYGFPCDNSLPPARNKYQVQAEIESEANNSFYLTTEGFGDPVVSRHDEKEVTNPYQQLSKYTYQQLFTISLDKLNKLPQDNQRQQQLQSILLGAGFSDLLKIQNISRKLSKAAKKIGGTNGNYDVYGFKEYNQQIEEGLEKREQALKQIDKFQEVKQDLFDIKERINNKNLVIKKAQAQMTILDILKSNFNVWEEKNELELKLERYDQDKLEEKYNNQLLKEAERLKEDYQQAEKDYRKAFAKLKEKIDSQQVIKAKDKLIEHREELLEFESEISGLREKIRILQRDKDEHQDKKEELKVEIQDYNNSWDDFSSVLEIKTDEIAKDELDLIKEEYRNTAHKLEKKKNKLEELTNREDFIKEQLQDEENLGIETNLKRYYFLAIIFLLGGGALAYAVERQVGFIVALTGVIGGSINFLFHFLFSRTSHQQKRKLESELEDISEQAAKNKQDIKRLEEKMEQLEDKITRYCEILNLPEKVSLTLISRTFKWIKDIKERINKWDKKTVALDKREDNLQQKLIRLNKIISDLSAVIYSGEINWKEDELFGNRNKMFMLLEEICEYLRLAENLSEVEIEQQEFDRKIAEFLPEEIEAEDSLTALDKFIDKCGDYQQVKELENKIDNLKTNVLASLRTERSKEAFIRLKDLTEAEINDQQLLTLFDNFYQQYSSLSDLEDSFQLAKEELNKLKERLDQLKKEEQSLKDRKEALATNQKLDEAKEDIIRARQKLRPLAEEFAVNKAASFILNQARDRFIDRIKDKLLGSASEILEDITQGEYEAILPHDDLAEIDFKLKAKGKIKHKTIGELSQGTKEQLFLAVRISRIRELNPNLPVILDDSLVNFDDYHLQKVVELLAELSKTHQIFILTCDSKLLKHLNNLGGNIQYWQLEKGKFKLSSSGQELINYLSV